MSTDQWVYFRTRLPTQDDADDQGLIDTLEFSNHKRTGLWNWIPPHVSDAVQLWEANGFAAWRKRR
jgi:hypothetical protein